MAYDILNDDLYEDKDSKKGKRTRKPIGDMRAFWIHFGIIIFFLFIIFFFFVSDISFNFGEEEKKKILTLSGDLKKFDKEYVGDLSVSSTHFIIKAPGASFEENSQEIEIDDFNGRILMENESIVFRGSAKEIRFGKNQLEINGQSFSLISMKRTNTKLYFETLELSFDEGTMEFSDSINFEFEESDIVLNGLNASINYDGKYVISGVPESFSLNYATEGIKLEYIK